MIYVNKNKARIIVPRINQSPEYEQNKVVDIIVTNQVTKETRELQLIDESTDKNYYEFDSPLHYDVRGYEGTYDYKIVFGNGSVVLSSGIVVVEPDNVADNVTDVKSYEYYPDKIVQYTPNTEYVPQVESIKEIKQNGDYWVKYYDRVIVDVPIPEPEEPEFEIPNVTEINGTVGLLYTYQNQDPITEIPTDMIDSEGNLILPDNYGAYVINKGGILNDSTTIIDGQWYYNSVYVEIEDKTKLIYRVKTTTADNVYLLARGLDNVVTTNPSIPLTRPLTNDAKAAIIEYMKKFDNKIIRWNGVEGYIVGINDVSSTPKIYNYPLSEEEYTTYSAGIFRGHTYLRKGGIYQVRLVHFNHYFKAESSITGQYVSGWVLTFDELVEVEGSGGGNVVLPNGTKLAYSTFTEVPENFDFSKVTDFKQMFTFCENLISVPSLDTSKGTDFGNMFKGCKNLTTIPSLDTSNGTNFIYMFEFCEKLTTIPSLDTSNGTQFNSLFWGCSNLITVPPLNTSKSSNFSGMFYNCKNLTTVSSLDTSKSTYNYNMFYGCNSLENINFVGSINRDMTFNNSPLLTYDSIKSILTACSNTTRTSAKTLKFNRTIADNNGELATLVGECTTKGWTITGLTLE